MKKINVRTSIALSYIVLQGKLLSYIVQRYAIPFTGMVIQVQVVNHIPEVMGFSISLISLPLLDETKFLGFVV